MTTQDKCCSLSPYFKVHAGKLAEFKKLTEAFNEKTKTEPDCLYYGFCFDGEIAHCREGYADAAALLHHLGNVDDLLKQALKMSDITRLEVHAPADELEKLRAPLAALKPQMFTLEIGFRR